MKEALREGVRQRWRRRLARQAQLRDEAANIGEAFARVLIQERQLRTELRWSPEVPAPPHIARDRRLHSVRIQGFAHPFYFRRNLSDLAMMEQIFQRREYEALPASDKVRLIVDCGANIGCSVVYFLARYPRATIVAIEPDEANFQVLSRNVKPYGERVIALNRGVWSRTTQLKVVPSSDGLSCAITVRPATAGEKADIEAITIEDASRRAGDLPIDLLKIDVEGTERELFGSNYRPWLDRTRMLAIEPHGPDCEEVFFRAIAEYDTTMTRSGEYFVCTDLRRKEVSSPVPAGSP